MSFSIKTGAQAVATGARAVAKGTGVLLDFLDNASVKLRPLSHIPLIGDTMCRTLYQCCTITITANIKRFRRS